METNFIHNSVNISQANAIHRTQKPEASIIVSFGNKSSFKFKLRTTRKILRALLPKRNAIPAQDRVYREKKNGIQLAPLRQNITKPPTPLLAFGERLLALRRSPSLSPWLIVHTAKCSDVKSKKKTKITGVWKTINKSPL
jgi:hypothetical protein